MEPQQPTNPTSGTPAPVPAKSNMGKIIALVVGLIIIIILAFFLFKGSPTSAPTDSDTLSNQSETANQDELSQIEQENENQDFSEIEADFSSEVNAAAQ
jgi:hypothetical protein